MKIRILFFSFFSFIFAQTSQSGENKQHEILAKFKQVAQKECEPNSYPQAFIADLDSLSGAESISETAFLRAAGQIVELLHQQGKLIPIIELYSFAAAYYQKLPNPNAEQIKSLIALLIPLGAAHEELGMWNRAFDYYHEALTLSEEYHFETQKARIYNNIGAIHYNHGELDKAEEYFQKAVEINKKSENKLELFNNYNNLGGIYVSRKEYDKSLDCALLAIQQLNHNADTELYYFMQTNIANLYLLKNEVNLAFSYLNNARIYQEKAGFSNDLVQTYLMLSKAYEENKQKAEAYLYIEKAIEQANKIDNKYIESRILKESADFYKRNGQIDKAYRALTLSTAINDSILQEDNQQKINNIERMYLIEKKSRENEMQIKNITLQKLASDRQKLVFAAIALLLIIIVLYLMNRSKNKERERKNEELLVLQQKELHEKEKELQRQKELELSNTIGMQNRELTTYTLSMTKNSEFISDLINDLKQLQIEIKDRRSKDQIRMIINKLNNFNSSDNYEEFAYYFEKVHPSFYQHLEQLFPDLTIKEKRLCAFLHLGLSSKEISAITFKEVRSVESARNRLRKKLGISHEQNLMEFVQSFNSGSLPESDILQSALHSKPLLS